MHYYFVSCMFSAGWRGVAFRCVATLRFVAKRSGAMGSVAKAMHYAALRCEGIHGDMGIEPAAAVSAGTSTHQKGACSHRLGQSKRNAEPVTASACERPEQPGGEFNQLNFCARRV
jgi:hypothetical protein